MLLIYFLLLFPLAIAELTMPWAGWSVCSFVILALYVRELAARYPQATSFMIHILMSRILLSFSLIFIAGRFFIRELGVTGDEMVYSAYFSMLSCLFLYITVITFRALDHAITPNQVAPFPILHLAFTWLTFILAVVAIAVMLWSGFTSGFALFDGVDRFVYRANQGWLFNVVITFKPVIAGLLGFVTFRMQTARLTRKIYFTLFALLFAVSTLFGDKFLSLIILAAFFFSSYFALGGRLVGRARTAAIVMGAFLTVSVSGLTYFIYSDYGRLDWSLTSERLLGRFTGQGQLWYANLRDAPPLMGTNEPEVAKLWDVMAAASEADDLAFNTRTGIFYMVARFAPDNIRDSVFNASGLVQFAGAGEAYLMILFGQIPAIVIWAILAVFCGASTYWIYNSLISGSLPGFVFSLFTLANFSTMINQGSFWQIFGVRALLYIAVMLSIDVVIRYVLGQKTVRPSWANPI